MGRALDYQTQTLLQGYIEELRKIYGEHLQKIILYGSRARGDFREDSDYDIMILTDLDELSQKKYQSMILVWITMWISSRLQRRRNSSCIGW